MVKLICGVLLLVSCTLAYTPTPHGVLVPVGSYQVELAVEGLTAFRVSVSNSNVSAPVKIASNFLDTQNSYASFSITTSGGKVGIRAPFGSVAIDANANFVLTNANGTVLTSSVLIPNLHARKPDTCKNVFANTDVTGGTRVPAYPQGLSGQTLAQCCALCNSNADCTVFVWADNTHPDPSGKNCWLLYNVPGFSGRAGRSSGGNVPPPPATISLQLGAGSGAKFYGAGGGFSTVMSLTASASSAHVSNTEFTVPHYWSTDGYAALGVSASQYVPNALNAYPATWSTGSGVQWQISGAQGDLYLMPSASLKEGQKVYWDLTGRPRVLPRYAYGFLASRWGWTDKAYIESMLTQFRSGNFPIDAWISDFEVCNCLSCH